MNYFDGMISDFLVDLPAFKVNTRARVRSAWKSTGSKGEIITVLCGLLCPNLKFFKTTAAFLGEGDTTVL